MECLDDFFNEGFPFFVDSPFRAHVVSVVLDVTSVSCLFFGVAYLFDNHCFECVYSCCFNRVFASFVKKEFKFYLPCVCFYCVAFQLWLWIFGGIVFFALDKGECVIY